MLGRREFLAYATSSLPALAMTGVIPFAGAAPGADAWDLKWPARLTGTRKAVFDVAEIDSGFGVFRAAVWAGQRVELLGSAPTDVSPVVVLRSHAVVLALQQSFWNRYSVGRLRRVTHPVSLKETARNPALMDATDGIPAPLANATLPKQLSRGVTVLACNLALQSWIDAVAETEKLSEAEARKQVVSALVPGVILQPSGVLATILAQEHGCAYIRSA